MTVSYGSQVVCDGTVDGKPCQHRTGDYIGNIPVDIRGEVKGVEGLLQHLAYAGAYRSGWSHRDIPDPHGGKLMAVDLCPDCAKCHSGELAQKG